jgi:hypothetical protein
MIRDFQEHFIGRRADRPPPVRGIEQMVAFAPQSSDRGHRYSGTTVWTAMEAWRIAP